MEGGWETAFCEKHQRHYYFNRTTNVSQWEPPAENTLILPPPPSWAGHLPGHSSLQPPPGDNQQPTEAVKEVEGWYYEDPHGQVQGPFSVEALRSFRWHLPMDLLVWYCDGPRQAEHKQLQQSQDYAATQQPEGSPGYQGSSPARAERPELQHGMACAVAEPLAKRQRQHEGSEEPQHGPPGREAERALGTAQRNGSKDRACAVELAELLGDGVLLTDWRSCVPQVPGASGTPCAPPAPAWEQWLLYGASSCLNAPAGTRDGEAQEQLARQQGHEEDGELDRGADSVTDYASAALAGLPPDDEAAVIARLAAASGKSLKEVIDFSYTHGGIRSGLSDPDEFVSAAEYNPRRRRLQLAGTEENAPGSLYRELSSWCNPEQLEKSLQAAASRRGKPLPASVWRQLKERKEENKKRARTAALLS